ncbi:hypothetical protein CRE_29165 [Caenorhabditis remanei]|uniref:DNA-directed DNA polymerase n=1 Tax=Caenorhabditis remanei TaxID=31234 RepID=E3N9J4_CAERE|nr:hypothetical protein CRE_29165 [Caenorhabditis remanei]
MSGIEEVTGQEVENVQVGGALLKVKRAFVAKSGGRFKNSVETVSLDVDIPTVFTSSPNGPDLFSEAVVKLIDSHIPAGMTPANLKVGVKFESEELVESVGLSFKKLANVLPRDIADCMEDMAQSNKNLLELEEPSITIHITYLNTPSGSGEEASNKGGEVATPAKKSGGKRKSFGIEDILGLPSTKKQRDEEEEEGSESDEDDLGDLDSGEITEEVLPKRHHLMPNKVSRNCLVHAIVQSLRHREWKQDKENKKKYNRYRRSLLKNEVREGYIDVFQEVNELKKKAGITKMYDFDSVDCSVFQEKCFAGQLQLVVFVKNSTIPYYSGPYVGKGKQIVLYLADGHYCGLRSVSTLLNNRFFCFLCLTKSTEVSKHYACRLLHRLCGKADCPPKTEDDVAKRCPACFVTFETETCYKNHLQKGPNGGKSRCDYTKYCQKCSKSYYTNKRTGKHECGESYCHRCQEKKQVGHTCTMMPSIKNEKKLTRKRGFFDVETRVCETTKRQIPTLFTCVKCCPKCSSDIPKTTEEGEDSKCSNCSPDGRLKVIDEIKDEGIDVGATFTEWMFDDKHRGFTFVAHNASGFDGQFILEALIASNKAAPTVCLDGTKLVYLEYNGVRLVDSLKYLTMSLSMVGKTFKVDSLKGDFPVHFIRKENFQYNGPIPENKYYALENKTAEHRKQLESFLEKERADGKVFNFYDELLRYCYNDVYILAASMTQFEGAFEKMTNVCLFEETTTAASAAALVFRRNHLDPKMPIVLDAKPSVSMNNSILSQKYLAWICESEKVQVNMSTTYGEEKIGNHRVDGYIPPCEKYPEGQIIEFFGCYYHGHTCTYSEESVIGEKSARDIWKADEERIKALKESGKCPVRVVYECDVKAELRSNREMSDFFDSYEAVDVLQCQRALVGGRTEVFRVYVDCKDGTGYYVDVVSLYPTVMKHEAFPIGAPENVQRSTFALPIVSPDGIPFEGFMSCKLQAPRDLRLPVIAGKVSGRLMFFLCKLCAKEGNQEKCTHSDEERSFTGTFTTVELKKALTLGYKIVEVYHGIKYEKWVKNDASGKGGLFTSYIDTMMKAKIYSSGWPSDVVTDAEKLEFCRGYMEKENIELLESLFEGNAGMRAVAKLLLNALWGKFAQRADRVNTEIILDPGKFWQIVHDTALDLLDVRPVNDVLIVQYRQREETLSSLKTSAVHLAAYVTAYARLRLYSLMEAVGPDNIVYTDTDSIIFKLPHGTPNPLEDKMGSYLGQLTNELKGTMKEFVSLGPKTYSYKEQLANGEEKVAIKAKGITINSEVAKKLNFEKMKGMVDEVLGKEDSRTSLLLPQHTMVRDKNHSVYSRNTLKQFRYTFNKRRLLPDGSTLPFGYFE